MDNAEIRRAENRGLPHVLPAPHSCDTIWYDFISNAEVFDRTREGSIAEQVQRRRLALYGYVCRLSDTVPANAALSLCIDARVGRRVDVRPTWKRQRGRPRNTWVRQVELDCRMTADAAWTAAADRYTWRALRPKAGHAVQ